jgi:hypothetical protein
MGSAVRATCECGYDQVFPIGGGMRNVQELCWFPCLGPGCNSIVQTNLEQKPLTCPDCKDQRITP